MWYAVGVRFVCGVCLSYVYVDSVYVLCGGGKLC